MTTHPTDKCIIYSRPEQVSQLFKYAKSHTLKVVTVFEVEDKSDQKSLFCMMEYIIDNGINKVIIPNCITLSWKIFTFLSVIDQLTAMEVSVVIADIDIETLCPDGKVNSEFKKLFKVLNSFDESFREETRDRLQKGLKEYLDNGGKLGRAMGYRKPTFAYRRQYYKELNLLEEGVSMKQCRRLTGTSLNTLKKLKRLFLTSK